MKEKRKRREDDDGREEKGKKKRREKLQENEIWQNRNFVLNKFGNALRRKFSCLNCNMADLWPTVTLTSQYLLQKSSTLLLLGLHAVHPHAPF